MPWILPNIAPPLPPLPPPPIPVLSPPDSPDIPVVPVGTDPYGIDLAIDAGGDLKVTHSGSLGAVAGGDNCAQALFLRLATSQGDLAMHPDYGSQLPSLVGSKMSVAGIANAVNSELQTLLATDPRFASANVVQVQTPATTGMVESSQLGVQARLSGGENLTLDNVSDPAPSDISLPAAIDPNVDPTLTYDPTIEQQIFADQSELDTLNDLNTLASLVSDLPPPP